VAPGSSTSSWRIRLTHLPAHVEKKALGSSAPSATRFEPAVQRERCRVGSQPGHNFPAQGGSRRSREDTKAPAVEFRRAPAESEGRSRTCDQHASGPLGPGFKSRAPDFRRYSVPYLKSLLFLGGLHRKLRVFSQPLVQSQPHEVRSIFHSAADSDAEAPSGQWLLAAT
jgi:hypothetical protein